MGGQDLNTEELRGKIDKALSQWTIEVKLCRQEEEDLKQAEQRMNAADEALLIAQEVAQQIQEQAQIQITSVVNRALQTVFDEPYTFKIRFDQKRGRTEASLVFERNGIILDDPLTEAGGGVVDVAAFALRLSSILLTRPVLRKVMILDEPFKNLSAEYHSRIRSLLITLSKELGVQIVLVTHIQALKIGKIYDLTNNLENARE